MAAYEVSSLKALMHKSETVAYTVAYVKNGVANGTFDLNPKHQRGEVHTRKWQMGIVDSLLHYGIPPVYFHKVIRSTSDGYQTVEESVDGKQRLLAILQFVNDDYRFELCTIPNLKGKLFSELTYQDKDHILSTKISCIIYDELTSERLQHMFQNFNQTKSTSIGELLNGSVNTAMIARVRALASSADVQTIRNSDSNKRYQHIEAVVRMSYMVYERTLRTVANNKLMEWFAGWSRPEMDEVRERISEVARLMEDMELKARGSKGNYLAILWFIMKNSEDDVAFLREHAKKRGFAFNRNESNSMHDPAPHRYNDLTEFISNARRDVDWTWNIIGA